MLNYTLLLHGLESSRQGMRGSLLKDVLGAVDDGARGAVRLRLEGRSRAGGGFHPAWVHTAAAFNLLRVLPDGMGVELSAPTLREALPDRFGQGELFPTTDPDDSALTLLGRSLDDAVSGRADSDAYDEALLTTFRGFVRIFHHGVQAVELRNGRPDAAPLTVTREGIRTVQRLRRQTPRPRQVRVAGKVEVIRHSDRGFVLVLDSGEQIRGVLVDDDAQMLPALWGSNAVVTGLAHFRPSGGLLRIDAEHVRPAEERDVQVWASAPRPLFGAPDRAAPPRAQTARSGIAAIFGMWPGDETDEELLALLEEIS
jgi:hypothetical protein